MPSSALKAAPALLSGISPPPALLALVLASLASPHTRRSYAHGIGALYAWKGARTLTPQLLLEWRASLSAASASGTANARLSAVRKLLVEGRAAGFLAETEAAPLLRISGLSYLGARVGNWLTTAQAQALLKVPDRTRIKGKRDFCILAVLLGTAIRVSELATLNVKQIQQRDGRWVLADVQMKRRVRTVAIPGWTMAAIRDWLKVSGIRSGPLIRQLTSKGATVTPQGLLAVVRAAGLRIGVAGLGPHDLRRTCARFMHAKGVDLDQIRIMLGHASLVTTQRYLGSMQNLQHAPNDDLGLS